MVSFGRTCPIIDRTAPNKKGTQQEADSPYLDLGDWGAFLGGPGLVRSYEPECARRGGCGALSAAAAVLDCGQGLVFWAIGAVRFGITGSAAKD